MDNEKKQVQYDTHYIANRMARTIGHVRLVRSMVECDADCTEVLIQLAAVRGQLDSICSIIMAQYTEKFAEEYRRTGNEVLIEQFKTELVRAIRKMVPAQGRQPDAGRPLRPVLGRVSHVAG